MIHYTAHKALIVVVLKAPTDEKLLAFTSLHGRNKFDINCFIIHLQLWLLHPAKVYHS